MRLSRIILVPGVFLLAAVLALAAAGLSVQVIETASKAAVFRALNLQGLEWVEVEADGLQVILSGTAENEGKLLRALSIAGGEVDSARVIDRMDVADAEAIQPPRFSVEILRNASGVSMIGLIPASMDRDAFAQRVAKLAGGAEVADFLETADYPMPDGWSEVMDFALKALGELPRSKISASAERVAVTAIADSAGEKRQHEIDLAVAGPEGVTLDIDISAPRPVITPFTTRFLIDEQGARFDACSAHTEAARAEILAAADAAGLDRRTLCTLGLGVPSPDWAGAVATGIAAVKSLGGGSITFSDVDVTLVAPTDTEQAEFDRVVGELEAALPELYALHAVLPEPVRIDGTGESAGTPEFIATKSPEGLVQLRGRLSDERQRAATESFARARFGVSAVYAATRLDDTLPEGWPTRVLAGLEALSYLSNGVVVVQPDVVDIRGSTGNEDARAEISRVLSEQLGEAQNFQVDVKYVAKLDPELALPSPEDCVADINGVIAENKISFDPGSAIINSQTRETINKIADLMKDCQDVPMEIGGHTDSQGREEMNQALSHSRAQAVLNALLARRVLTTNLTARGYGETRPIADNGTEEGREANRRIEFRLIGAAEEEEVPQEDGAGAEAEPPADGDGADAPAENDANGDTAPATEE